MDEAFDLLRFLPTSAKEVKLRGWDGLDIILFSGDAYVDHPSFGMALLGRLLLHKGYRVALVPQPNWRDDLRDFKKLGSPRLFFGVGSGSMDSMMNHYTAARRLRSEDAYTPDGRAGSRPDYAVTVYCRILKELYPEVPLIIGGIEASLRRFTHYDYWKDELKPSVLVESGADMLVWGMGENPLLEIARGLEEGVPLSQMRDIPQTAYCLSSSEKYLTGFTDRKTIRLNGYNKCLKDSRYFAEDFVQIEEDSNRKTGSVLIEPYGDKVVVVNPSRLSSVEEEMDLWYDLPFTRLPHPRYKGKRIPAYEMIRFSVTAHRGCFGGCSFCTISAHQGKFVVSRTEASILSEVAQIARMEDFRGYISDIGGPSANMYGMQGKDLRLCHACKRPSCLFPLRCKNLDAGHGRLLRLYREARSIQGVKKIFIGSGIRYDLFLTPIGEFNTPVEREWFRDLLRYHVSGRLKVAPEHTSPRVLHHMRKPPFNYFRHLYRLFNQENTRENLREQVVPYFISSHPGCTLQDMKDLAAEVCRLNLHLEQVQDFTPTPMTLSSVMYYTGKDPYSGSALYVPRSKEEKQAQKQYFFPKGKGLKG